MTTQSRGVVPRTELGRRIDDLAKQKGLSRTQLAKRIEMIPVSFNKALTKTKLPMDVAPALARELGVSLEYLLTGQEGEAWARAKALCDAAKDELDTALLELANAVRAHEALAEMLGPARAV